jgi:hypothetical protein
MAAAAFLAVSCGSHGSSPATTTTTTTAGGTAGSTAGTPAGISGQPMPTGDLPGWHQVFADDFRVDVPLGGFSQCDNTTRACAGLPAAVGSRWWAYPDGWPDTSRQGVYMPSKTVSIADGLMHLQLHTENGVHMVAAVLPKIPAAGNGAQGPEGGQLYARYAIRFEVEHPTAGYKIAWLLWPDSEQFPADGEIDFPETPLTGTIGGYLHHMNGVSPDDQDTFDTGVPVSSGWHTAVVEWTAASVTFQLDGVTMGVSTSRIPSTPMHLVIQNETDGSTSDSAVADILVAWVVVYQPARS